MKCPIDQSELLMNERQGVEIDYCPKCRGIWLDRGELDKIIEKSENAGSPVQPNSNNNQNYMPPNNYPPNQNYYGKHGRRKSMLGELFDF